MIRALLSRIPQIILPFGADRPENAARIQSLGVAAHIRPTDWEAHHVGRILLATINSSTTRSALATISQRMRDRNELEKSCSAIEELTRRSVWRRSSHPPS